MNEAENNDTNVAEAAVDAGMANNPIPSQEVAPLEQEPQESSPIGADTVSPVSLNEATETKSEPSETQPVAVPDASKTKEPAAKEPAEPSGDLNNVTDTSPASEPVQEPVADTGLDDVLHKLSAIESKLDTMSITLDILARQKEDNITRLNAELDKFKADMRFDVKKSLISDIIDEVNLMSKEYRSLKAKSTEAIDSTRILEDFRLFAEEDFLECLERHQVYAIRTEAGKPFDNLRHIKRGKVPTDNPELDGKVCESISDGFEARLQMNPASAEPVFRVLQREKVSVYSFTPSDTPATPPETTVEK